MTLYAYFQKQFVPLFEVKIGVMAHCLHCGTARLVTTFLALPVA